MLKAHGTGNDFIVIPDLDGEMSLSPRTVAELCDRHTGVGADGILRVVRTCAIDDPAAANSNADFFMDYRNADGSLAQMCGNGARVFAEYLVRAGLVRAGQMLLGTRGGDRAAWAEGDGEVTVAMGKSTVAAETAVVGIGSLTWPATAVFVPNPHAVAIVSSLAEAGALDEPPTLQTSLFPEGANVEFLEILEPGKARMRVHERGVGETLSCGTGACAAAVVLWQSAGVTGGEAASAQIDVPGGQLRIDRDLEGELYLRGPVEFVATVEVESTWWQRVAR